MSVTYGFYSHGPQRRKIVTPAPICAGLRGSVCAGLRGSRRGSARVCAGQRRTTRKRNERPETGVTNPSPKYLPHATINWSMTVCFVSVTRPRPGGPTAISRQWARSNTTRPPVATAVGPRGACSRMTHGSRGADVADAAGCARVERVGDEYLAFHKQQCGRRGGQGRARGAGAHQDDPQRVRALPTRNAASPAAACACLCLHARRSHARQSHVCTRTPPSQ